MTSGYFERELTRLRTMTSEARARFGKVAEGLADIRRQLTIPDGRRATAPLAASPDKPTPAPKLRPEILFK